MVEDLAERVDAVLADARDAVAATDDGGSDEAPPRLRAVADAAAGLVEEADADALLSAVGLGGEDGYDSLPTALAEGDEERVLALERLLKLSALADGWDDSDAADRRAELADLFDVDAGADEDATEPPADEAESGADTETESDADAAEDETDDGGVVSRAADEVVDAVVEEFAGDDGKAETATGDAGTAAADAETAADTGDDGSLSARVEAAAADLRDGLDEVRGEADDAKDADEDADDGDRRPTERLSTIPEHGRNPTRFSTMPEGGSSTRFSTMPKRR